MGRNRGRGSLLIFDYNAMLDNSGDYFKRLFGFLVLQEGCNHQKRAAKAHDAHSFDDRAMLRHELPDETPIVEDRKSDQSPSGNVTPDLGCGRHAASLAPHHMHCKGKVAGRPVAVRLAGFWKALLGERSLGTEKIFRRGISCTYTCSVLRFT